MPIDRRRFAALLALLTMPLGSARLAAQAMSRATAFGFSFKTLDGNEIKLADHGSKAILVVNTASLCGYTPQYAGLESLWARYRSRGLLVLGVPSNDFGDQEPGGASDIHATAHRHGVTFPLTEKVSVKGDNAHPFYRWAAVQRPTEQPRWNFHKYLVGRDGSLVAAFPSAIEPTDPRIIVTIERELLAS